MLKILHQINMHAQDFQEPIPKYKEIPSEKNTKWRNHHLEDIIKRYIKEWDIHWNPQNDIKLPKERMVPNKPSSLQSFMMAQSTKKKRLAFHQHTLDKDHKMSVVATRPQTVWSLCSGVIPGSVMLTPHSTRRIYNRVAITHLLHRVSQKRTYYNKYGLRRSNRDDRGRLGV